MQKGKKELTDLFKVKVIMRNKNMKSLKLLLSIEIGAEEEI